ncbi:MAG: spore coat protein [Clostridia bacterium]|nr:spore coat protein [Clostridia bacterium]
MPHQNQSWAPNPNQNQRPQFNQAPQAATYQAAQAAQAQPLSDQELAFDLLYQEKALLVNTASQVLEAAHPGLRQALNDCYLQMGQDQLEIFHLMNQKNWYQTKPAQAQDIQTAKQKFQQMRNTI